MRSVGSSVADFSQDMEVVFLHQLADRWLYNTCDIPLPSHPIAQAPKLTAIAQIKNIDPIGVFFFVPCIIGLILALQWGGSFYLWSAPHIIGLFVTFAVLFVVFGVVEVLMPETGMGPARVVMNRSVAASMLIMLLLSGGMMAIMYYLTIWFQVVKGDSAIDSGVHTIPWLLSMIILAIPTAIFRQEIGYYVPALLVTPFLCATGAGLLSTLRRAQAIANGSATRCSTGSASAVASRPLRSGLRKIDQ
jgi:hypothetical protein